MNYKIIYSCLLSVFLFQSCQKKIEYVSPDWAQQLLPANNTQVKIDYFDTSTSQEFTWLQRPASTYKISIATDQDFKNPITYDVGAAGSFKLGNADFFNDLKKLNPAFSNAGRFFWRLEQNTGGKIESVWRYFDVIVSVTGFIDPRDNESYKALQYMLPGGKLVTIMSENLRASTYTDGSPLVLPRKLAPGATPEAIKSRTGGYYSWATVVRDEAAARTKTLEGKNIQGICPDGWHVPSFPEWKELITYWSPSSGDKVKNPEFWTQNGYITGEAKFNVVPGGFYWNEWQDGLADLGGLTGFWSSSPSLSGYQFSWETLTADRPGESAAVVIYNDPGNRDVNTQSRSSSGGGNFHYHVRCIMD
ncbi:major paralogous domain-containing protein [Pedobacter sp. ok626]|uniref:FISUMP domain-containing protein n=1 Tax=Pedobacter sp. ok626 TaxID=1761882 RepID=UPI000890936A|nr:FISUMP domain-containing protein [Pedobacter sp. ok626]SDK56270.1 major paralogous domain-containing protein [Pedobacter sp. ok626]